MVCIAFCAFIGVWDLEGGFMSVMCYDGCMILRTGGTWHIEGMGLCFASSEDVFFSIGSKHFWFLYAARAIGVVGRLCGQVDGGDVFPRTCRDT